MCDVEQAESFRQEDLDAHVGRSAVDLARLTLHREHFDGDGGHLVDLVVERDTALVRQDEAVYLDHAAHVWEC